MRRVRHRRGHATHTFRRCFQRSPETTGFGVSVESDGSSLVANSVLSVTSSRREALLDYEPET